MCAGPTPSFEKRGKSALSLSVCVAIAPGIVVGVVHDVAVNDICQL